MEYIECLNCRAMLKIKEIKKGTDVVCKCGCQQRCLDKDKHISRWRVINPFSFEDKR